MSKEQTNPRQDGSEHETERQVQQELENQLRSFGSTVNDAFRHGFEGRGQEIGDRAYDVGRAVVDAANLGISKVGKALRSEWNNAKYQKQNTQDASSEMPAWAKQIFGMGPEPTPVDEIRTSAKKRHNAGLGFLIAGILFTALFGLGGVTCLVLASSFEGSFMLAATAVDLLYGTGTVLTLVGLCFLGMVGTGADRLEAAKQLNCYADAAEGLDASKGLPLEMLAGLAHEKKKRTLKNLRRLIKKGWLSAWLDEKKGRLFLTAESYRAAQKNYRPAEAKAEPAAAAPSAQEQTPPEAEKTPMNLEAVCSFAQVLEKQKKLMRDERAVEELEHMHRTTRSICDWLESHPESLPKARRFAEYYIPTTLKLLYTYNDVQGQKGGNAEAIRRDIAGILHTLNQGYDTLYDKLLSDMALDVSSEIAALEGMLACDGLTGEGLR